MIKAIKRRGIVGKDGKIEIQISELPEGTIVEIIVSVEPTEQDATEYLLSTEANRSQLLQALQSAENPDNLVVVTPDEWNAKYHI